MKTLVKIKQTQNPTTTNRQWTQESKVAAIVSVFVFKEEFTD